MARSATTPAPCGYAQCIRGIRAGPVANRCDGFHGVVRSPDGAACLSLATSRSRSRLLSPARGHRAAQEAGMLRLLFNQRSNGRQSSRSWETEAGPISASPTPRSAARM